jgi:hypothetical protein
MCAPWGLGFNKGLDRQAPFEQVMFFWKNLSRW